MVFVGVNPFSSSVFILTFEITRFLRAPASSALIYESISQESAGKVFAVLWIASLAFNVLGAVLIGYLVEYKIFSYVYALITLAALALTINLEETLSKEHIYSINRTIKIIKGSLAKIKEGFGFLASARDLRRLMILAGILELTGFMSWMYVPLVLSHRGISPDTIGYVYGFTVVARSVGTLIGGYLLDKYGPIKQLL